MLGFTDRQSFLVAVIFYGLSVIYSVFLWKKGFRESNRINYFLLLFGFAFHTVAMLKRGFSFNACPVNNLYELIAFIAWTLVACYLVIGVVSRLRFLGAFASPVVFAMGVFALMPALDAPYSANQPNFKPSWPSVHAALIMLSFGAFGLSAVAALMYLTQEHNLKFNKLRAILAKLPPIQRLEVVIVRSLVGGLVLLSIGLTVSLIHFVPRPKFSDPIMVWSAFVWIIYLAQLLAHRFRAASGRRFALGAVGSFAFVLLTFWGFYLLSGIHKH